MFFPFLVKYSSKKTQKIMWEKARWKMGNGIVLMGMKCLKTGSQVPSSYEA